MYILVFIFSISIGLPTILLVWWLGQVYSNQEIGGWALVCFHLAIGFLSIGLFGVLSIFSHKAQGSVNFPKFMPISAGPLLATGVFFILCFALLNKNDIPVSFP
jgi:hypothetical protein